MPIFTSKKLTDILGEEYLLVRSEAEVPQHLTVVPLSFNDPYYTQSFLRKLHTPREFWRDMAQNFDGNAHLHWMDDSTILQRIADLIIRRNLNLYKLKDTNRWNSSLKPFKAKDGYFYQVAPKKSPIFNKDEPKLEFSTTDQAKQFIQDNKKALNLSALGKQLGLPSNKTRAEHSPALLDDISLALVTGDVVVMRQKTYSHTKPQELVSSAAPNNKVVPLSSPSEQPDTWYEFSLVDEIGKSVSGVELSVAVDGGHKKIATDGGGKIRIDAVKNRFAIATFPGIEDIYDAIGDRWDKKREGEPPNGNIISQHILDKDVSPATLKSETSQKLVISPPLGQLFAELKDKTGAAILRNCAYEISGPEDFSGTTDSNGILQHKDVLPGDYKLTIKLENYAETPDSVTDSYQAPLVVLASGESKPQIRRLGILPNVIKASITGMLFDTNKCFILPSAIQYLKHIRELYLIHAPCQLLIVGHSDVSNEPSINDPLSLERAEKVKAYLEDNIDDWLDMYNASGSKQWGNREDRLMIRSVPDFGSRPPEEDIIRWFQRTRNLKVDGIAGPETRRQLITEYMELDGVNLSELTDTTVEITTHGCGENFPIEAEESDAEDETADDAAKTFSRRVELFFFDPDFDITPAPSSADGAEYLTWKELSAENHEFPIAFCKHKAVVIEAHDTLFRTNSCVVLPEGENPDNEAQHASYTSTSIFAAVLRYSDEFAGKSLIITGHADSTSSIDFNQTLSEERAECTLAILTGDREKFVSLVDNRHKVADYKQILSWCCHAFDELIFTCDPGIIDDNEATLVNPVKRFQEEYNSNKASMGAGAQPDLSIDGDVGPKTIGAFFDLYEYALRSEMGEDAESIKEIRANIRWVEDETKFLGFSEHHPVDKMGQDNVRSQSNRRVEFLFFDAGEEPDIALAKSDPDISEMYIPGMYQHENIPIPSTAKRKKFALQFVDENDEPIDDFTYELTTDTGYSISGETQQATVAHKIPADAQSGSLTVDNNTIDLTFAEAE